MGATSRRRRGVLVFALLAFLAPVLVADSARAPSAALAAENRRTGTPGPSFAGTSAPTGTKRPQSAVWWNDGSWWAVMWDVRRRDFHIFSFDRAVGIWRDTETRVDERSNSRPDVLWNGRHLYVASHKSVRDQLPSALGEPSYLFRFSYRQGRRRYVLDRGFPTVINRYRTETLVIDEDSTGRIWATWPQGGSIYVSRTVDSKQRVWGKPFRLPFAQADVTVDDISSLVAFSGRIGIMWSNQGPEHDGMWFTTHRDHAPRDEWTNPEPALKGDRAADDHINLKADAAGVVYAAVKTSAIHADPLTLLLVRSRAEQWTSHIHGLAVSCDNRPTLSIDEGRQQVRMFATGPPPTGTCSNSGGAIYEKDASLAAPSFHSDRRRLVMYDSHAPFLHNASTSKRNAPSSAGVMVLAVNQKTRHYWTHFVPRRQ